MSHRPGTARFACLLLRTAPALLLAICIVLDGLEIGGAFTHAGASLAPFVAAAAVVYLVGASTRFRLSRGAGAGRAVAGGLADGVRLVAHMQPRAAGSPTEHRSAIVARPHFWVALGLTVGVVVALLGGLSAAASDRPWMAIPWGALVLGLLTLSVLRLCRARRGR